MVCEVVVAIAAKRPTQQQHFCADRGYDYTDVHTFVLGAGYTPHIKHRRRRGEAAAPKGDVPGKPAFRRGAGWSSEPSTGCSSAALCGHAGARKPATG